MTTMLARMTNCPSVGTQSSPMCRNKTLDGKWLWSLQAWSRSP